jgi:hypothetical protein
LRAGLSISDGVGYQRHGDELVNVFCYLGFLIETIVSPPICKTAKLKANDWYYAHRPDRCQRIRALARRTGARAEAYINHGYLDEAAG